MPSSDTLTYDQSPPRRPTLDDLGGGEKVNDGTSPPDPVRHLTAEDANQTAQQIAAIGRVMPVGRVSVRIGGGGAHVVDKQNCAPSAATLLSFTVTDHGTGDIEIRWAQSLFPPAQGNPVAHATGSNPALIATEATTQGSSTYGARVRTQNAAGAALDVPFELEIF